VRQTRLEAIEPVRVEELERGETALGRKRNHLAEWGIDGASIDWN
jgi:hypothetical protein